MKPAMPSTKISTSAARRSEGPSRGKRSRATALASSPVMRPPSRYCTRENDMELIRESLDHCVKCTVCETFCPVSNATPLFPGPKYVGPQAERFRSGDRSPDASLDLCSGCGICTQVCPQGVHIAEINAQARAKLRERTGFTLRDRLLARPDVIGRLSTPAAPLVNRALSSAP